MKGEKGFSLIEVLVALAIVSLMAVGLLSALRNSIQASTLATRKDVSRSLAQSQMEYIKKQPFATAYVPDTVPSDYDGYSTNITVAVAAERDSSLQKITISIYHNGSLVSSLEDYKTKR